MLMKIAHREFRLGFSGAESGKKCAEGRTFVSAGSAPGIFVLGERVHPKVKPHWSMNALMVIPSPEPVVLYNAGWADIKE